MTRFKAFLVHLGISLVIFGVLAALVVYVWYPDFFFSTDGGWEGMRIIVLVDLVLGPLMTLVVFNRDKGWPVLRRDLAMIGGFQLACLVAGTYVVYEERPLALVYVDGAFYSMSADSYADVGADVPDLTAIPGPWPKRVVVKLPEDPAAQSHVREQALRNHVPLRAMAELYEPMRYADLDVADEAITLEDLQSQPGSRERLDRWLAAHGGSGEDFAFFSFGARYVHAFLGVSKNQQRLVDVLRISRDGLWQSQLARRYSAAETDSSR